MSVASVGNQIGRAGSGMTSEIAPWVERLARVGYAAKALLYGTIGVLAAQAALGNGGQTTDSRGAMREVLQAPFGRALLFIVALGLVGYAVWRVVQGITDPEGRGKDPKGLALRGSYVARGLLHLGLALSAFRLASGSGDSGGGGQRQEELTARAMESPGGEALVWLIGAGILGYGLYQLYRAYAAKLSKQLDLGQLSAETGRWAIGISRFGIAARGVVFSIIGGFMLQAAMRNDPQQAGGVGDSLRRLGEMGRWPLAVVAIGLVAYGAYELLNARYRRIQAR
jgi:hypothetical protein